MSLHVNFHHQIVFVKFDLNVYPPPYHMGVWYYIIMLVFLRAKKYLASFNWEQAFSNSFIAKKISTINKKFINVMGNYIPNETKVRDEQNPF